MSPRRSDILTHEIERESGEVVREFDVVSAATVLTAFIGGLFLVFFLAAFLPWLLSKGMTAAVDGVMDQIGFGSFHTNTIWSWLVVLAIFAVFTAFIVAIVTAILATYNLLSARTGMGMHAAARTPELVAAAPRPALVAPRGAARADATFDQLYAEAQRLGIRGRSTMTKDELRAALGPRTSSTRRGRHT
jgi:hypothetical protein